MAVNVSSEDILKAQSHIWNHNFIFLNTVALKCAVQLGIPDAIDRHGSSPMPLSQLIPALQLHTNKTSYIERLMRVLVHSGFFAIQKAIENGQEEDGYVLTNSSRLLVRNNPLTMAPFVLPVLDPGTIESIRSLPAWFRSEDRSPFHTAHGMSIWEYLDTKTSNNESKFVASMESDSKLVISILLEKYKGLFDGIHKLVDIGGGTGTVAKNIAEAFPEMECTVLDLPQVVANLKGKENLKYVGGNMLEAIPSADAFLLKWILHDWNDEECVKILKNCKEAIASNEGSKGKVMVIDMLVGSEKTYDFIEAQLCCDMQMMLVTGGKERNESEWALLVKQAGFTDYKIFPILGLRSLIEIYP